MKRLPDFDGLRFVLCLGIACFHYSFRIPVKNEALQGFILTFAYFTDVFLSYPACFSLVVAITSGMPVIMWLSWASGWRRSIRCMWRHSPVTHFVDPDGQGAASPVNPTEYELVGWPDPASAYS